jgi:hypothetical protein
MVDVIKATVNPTQRKRLVAAVTAVSIVKFVPLYMMAIAIRDAESEEEREEAIEKAFAYLDRSSNDKY